MIRNISWCGIALIGVTGCAASAVDEASAVKTHASLQVTLSTELDHVLLARWEGFKSLATELPNREVLSVELIRTRNDATAAVLTIAQNGEPIRYFVMGDSRGIVRPLGYQLAARAEAAAAAEAFTASAGEIDPSLVTLGVPPPQQPGTPGVVAAGARLLLAAFNDGDWASGSSFVASPVDANNANIAKDNPAGNNPHR